MADTPINPRPYYVYALFREDRQTPFYIGMGKGDRWLDHERLAHRNVSHKNHVIMQMRQRGVSKVPKIKLACGLDKESAMTLEMDLIHLLGRHPRGPLTNISGGREGILNLTPECLAARKIKVAEAQKRPEVNAKRSASQRGKTLGPSPLRGRSISEEHRQKLMAAQSNRSPETKEKMRQNALRRWADPEFRDRASKWGKQQWENPEVRAKNVAGLKAAWASDHDARLHRIRPAMSRGGKTAAAMRYKKHQKTDVSQE